MLSYVVLAEPKEDCKISLACCAIWGDTFCRIPPTVYCLVESGFAECAAVLNVTGIVCMELLLVSNFVSFICVCNRVAALSTYHKARTLPPGFTLPAAQR